MVWGYLGGRGMGVWLRGIWLLRGVIVVEWRGRREGMGEWWGGLRGGVGGRRRRLVSGWIRRRRKLLRRGGLI